MRQLVLDTETTGLDPATGHKIIEIGCVEIINRRVTGKHYHQYINPQRIIEQSAIEVHGITNEQLADEPLFADIADEFLAFIKGTELIIHNAPFDVGFLNHELQHCGLSTHDTSPNIIDNYASIIDTLMIARKKHPGQRNSLDALCRRYHVDNSQRDLHGALLDAEILADVYLAMTGGQTSLLLDERESALQRAVSGSANHQVLGSDRPALQVLRANEQELAEHQRCLQAIDQASSDGCLWLSENGG